jgi:hypothetical protein
VIVPSFGFAARAVGAARCALVAASVLYAVDASASEPAATYDSVPLRFEANRGRLDENVRFVARGQGYSLFLTPDGATLALHRQATRLPRRGPSLPGEQSGPLSVDEAVVRMKLVGARTIADPEGIDEQAGQVRYYIGNNPAEWQDVRSYARVRYAQVLPGIDLVYYSTGQRQLEYDLVVAAGADPRRIATTFEGADRVEIDSAGGVVLGIGDAEIHQRPPFAYQTDGGGERERVASRYVRRAGGAIGVEVGHYDRTRPLIIDPELVYSTYFGGTGQDFGIGIAYAGAGFTFVVGQTLSTNFPTTPAAFQKVGAGSDAFVSKMSPNGNILAFSTYLGGSGSDYAWKVAVDGAGNVYVTGQTDSTNFPTTLGAYQTGFAGGQDDVFVTKLSSIGSLIYSTYLGGIGSDEAWGIAVDANGSAYVAGNTTSSTFPTTPGAFQTTRTGSVVAPFLTKLTPNGSALAYSTFIWGPSGGVTPSTGAYDVAVDASGNAYVTGYTDSPTFPTTPGAFRTVFKGGLNDVFITKLNPSGGALVYSTYLGGSGSEFGRAIALGADGTAYVTGDTNSANFPLSAGAVQTLKGSNEDSFVAKLSADGSSLLYSTFLGGSGDDNSQDITVDFEGHASVTGSTLSDDFPTTDGAFQRTRSSTYSDVYVTTLSTEGDALVYSTYVGGALDDIGYGIASDSVGNIFVTGSALSADYPTTPGAYRTTSAGDYEGFVTKFHIFTIAPATSTASVATLALLLSVAGVAVMRARRSARR